MSNTTTTTTTTANSDSLDRNGEEAMSILTETLERLQGILDLPKLTAYGMYTIEYMQKNGTQAFPPKGSWGSLPKSEIARYQKEADTQKTLRLNQIEQLLGSNQKLTAYKMYTLEFMQKNQGVLPPSGAWANVPLDEVERYQEAANMLNDQRQHLLKRELDLAREAQVLAELRVNSLMAELRVNSLMAQDDRDIEKVAAELKLKFPVGSIVRIPTQTQKRATHTEHEVSGYSVSEMPPTVLLNLKDTNQFLFVHPAEVELVAKEMKSRIE